MRIYFYKLVDGRIVAQDLAGFRLRDPIDGRVRIRTPNLGKGREGVNDVADGSELDEKDPHVSSMLPKIMTMFEPISCSVPEEI